MNSNLRNTLPIEHLSYSSLKLYCSNRMQWKKNYVEGRWDRYRESIAALIGTGVHKTLELYYDGAKLENALMEGQKEILKVPVEKFDFDTSKNNRESILKEMTKAVHFFLNENPVIGEIIATEPKEVVDLFLNGELQPLPIKGKVDLITKHEDDFYIWDYKVVAAHSDFESDETKTNEENRMKIEKPDYIMQSIFNFYIVKAIYKKDPKKMIFIEIKKTENRDKTKRQLQLYEIEFEKHPEYFVYFEKLYKGMIFELLSPHTQYLPNFGDMFTGQESWFDFTTEISDFSLPEQISHKSAMARIKTPKEYTESILNNVTGEHLKPEEQIIAKLVEFGIPVAHIDTHVGANVTMYTFKPSPGIKVKSIKEREEDIMLGLGEESVRVIAPIPGTKTVGIEVSNKDRKIINFTEDLYKNNLIIPVGQDVYGQSKYLDLEKAPHLLVAGTTGSGKSVFLNSLIKSIAEQNTDGELKLVLIDPKKTEFIKFSKLPHIINKTISEIEDIYNILKYLTEDMDYRYEIIGQAGCVNITEFNNNNNEKMFRIVVVIDELADILLSKETGLKQEERISKQIDEGTGQVINKLETENTKIKYSKEIKSDLIRLAQKARAAGIHIVAATQRPSVDIVDGILKANFPTRIAFRVSTQIDSKVIIDQTGAERLLGNGDCLLMSQYEKQLIRLQGFYFNN